MGSTLTACVRTGCGVPLSLAIQGDPLEGIAKEKTPPPLSWAYGLQFLGPLSPFHKASRKRWRRLIEWRCLIDYRALSLVLQQSIAVLDENGLRIHTLGQ